MPLLPTLQTDRLVLRPQRVDDAEIYHRLWTERDSRIPAHRRIDAAGRPTVEDIAARLRAEGDGDGLGFLAVERRGVGLVGYCGLARDDDAPPDEPVLAYELLQAAHGQGYATEAAGAVVAWATDTGLPRLRAEVWDWNLASRRVLEKLGFSEVGSVGARSVHGQSLLAVRDL